MSGASLPADLQHHYLSFGTFTNPGLYKQRLIDDLPSDIRRLGVLVRKNIVHRTTLAGGNSGTNADLRFGDMTRMPWWRQPEDDILVTTAAMLAELYRRDDRGFVGDRSPQDKLILTCRYVAVLMASILKAKGIPARARSGNAGYFEPGRSDDHWINQYWDEAGGRWVTIDADGSLSLHERFDPYDIPDGTFDFPGRAWLDIRSDNVDPAYFCHAGGERGAVVVAWSLFHDFHSLMHDENIYLHIPSLVRVENFPNLTEQQRAQIDELALLMLEPDANFGRLQELWNTNREFRLLSGALL